MTLTATTSLIDRPTIEREDATLLNSRYMIATLSTRNSRYTLLKRQALVVLVKDADVDASKPHPIPVGTVVTGTEALVEASYGGDWTRYTLRIWNAEGDMVFMSSYIESAYVLEN